jgi:hypothetical protein
MQFKFDRHYALVSLSLLLLEIAIALFVNDQVIRPFVGDLLVVVLIYTFIRTFVQGAVQKIALVVLFFACGVEALQGLHLVSRLGLQNNRLARIMIGTTFDWKDMLAYLMGTALILLFELKLKKKNNPLDT